MLANKLALAAAPVVEALAASGFYDLEKQLIECIALAVNGSEEERLASLNLIQGLCHIKALGDVGVQGQSDMDWLNMLSALRSVATEAKENSAHTVHELMPNNSFKPKPLRGSA